MVAWKGYLLGMNDDIQNTIEVLAARIRGKEEEANKLKKLVNELCSEAGIDIRYRDIAEGGGVSAIRSDHFYGQTLPAAIRNYLELRKASGLGASSVQEIYRAIKNGGYKFGTNSEDNAKTSVGNALRSTNSIFHRLPNGEYGLLAWYPNAKTQPESEPRSKSKARGKSKQLQLPETTVEIQNGDKKSDNLVTAKEIRDVILDQTGQFQASTVEAAIKAKYPTKELPKTKIPSVLFILKTEKGLLKEISPRIGKKGAVYAKV